MNTINGLATYQDPNYQQYDFIVSNPYPFMGAYSKKLLFESFWEQIEQSMYGDRDGYEFSEIWLVYEVTAVHHYQVEQREGGDSYCGIYEPYAEVVRDEIEIVSVYDTVNEVYCNDLRDVLNAFGKENKLLSNL